MTAAEAKRELKRLGFRVVTEKVPFGGTEYLVFRIGSDESVASGWTGGNTTDALRCAYEDALRLSREVAA
jgi:hypothetical protein